MRRWTAALGALGLMLASSPAIADEVVDGVLDRVDEAERTVTLSSGQVFMLEATHEFTDIEPGEQVTITYEERDGQNMVLSIKPAEPNQ